MLAATTELHADPPELILTGTRWVVRESIRYFCRFASTNVIRPLPILFSLIKDSLTTTSVSTIAAPIP